jgi:transmembrane sensor
MSESGYENAIDTQAALWIARLDAGELPKEQEKALERWLASDSRHRGAFLRAQAAWHMFDRASVLPNPGENIAGVVSRRRMLAVSGAAAAAAVGTGGSLYLWRSAAAIETPVGEMRRVALKDGSIATVNTNSLLEVALKHDVRVLTIEKGEAWFDVAKDRARPFVVAAGKVRVRAVGTAFSVRRRDDGADVLVTEGMVETWTMDAPKDRKHVKAGSLVFVSDVAGPSQVIVAAAQVDRALAWRNGQIALDGETLESAANEFNRYNTRRLTIDPALEERRFVGWFRTNEPETFADAAAKTLNASVVVSDDEIHIAPKMK